MNTRHSQIGQRTNVELVRTAGLSPNPTYSVTTIILAVNDGLTVTD